MKLLSRIEEIILLSIWRLGDNAYGITIREAVVEATGQDWLLGAIYAPLSRLYKNGYVKTSASGPRPERGGRTKILYRLTPRGQEALAEVRRVNERVWRGLPAMALDKET
jgi:DNA-binding PadR family transcriptional regulator